MSDVLRVVGAVAGLSGLSLGVLLLVYRDLASTLIRQRAFRTLSSNQATLLLGAAIVFTFAIATLGLFTSLAAGRTAGLFIALVALLLLFCLAVLWLLMGRSGRQVSVGEACNETSPFEQVRRLIHAGKLDQADRAVSSTAVVHGTTPDHWYWKARLAIAHDNLRGAVGYANEGLKWDANNVFLLALKIKVLVLSAGRKSRSEARDLAASSEGRDARLDAWLATMRAEGMFDSGVRSATEIDRRCPFPEPSTTL